MIASLNKRVTAKLTLAFITYKEETTDWPNRFIYLSVTLEVPPKYTYRLTTLHTCLLCLQIAASVDTKDGQMTHIFPLRLPIVPGTTIYKTLQGTTTTPPLEGTTTPPLQGATTAPPLQGAATTPPLEGVTTTPPLQGAPITEEVATLLTQEEEVIGGN